MKRNLIGTLSLVVLSLLFNATGAYARAVVNADVPFAFTIGNKQMSAGRYTILTVGEGSIAIQDRDTGASALSLARTESRRNVSPKLVFHHVGNHYFLAQIWSGVGGAGLVVPSSKLEKELQIAKAPSSSPEEVVLALK